MSRWVSNAVEFVNWWSMLSRVCTVSSYWINLRQSYQGKGLILQTDEHLAQVFHFKAGHCRRFEDGVTKCAISWVVVRLVHDLDATSDMADSRIIMTR